MLRTALYYGFQPLFDALITQPLAKTNREEAVQFIDGLIKASTQYIASYYLGEPHIEDLKQELEANLHRRNWFSQASYSKKSRNIDTNNISPWDIKKFIKQYIKHVSKSKRPDYIIGCACGSSEIVMALAGIIEVPLGFIRKSHRRGDTTARIIPEQEAEIRKNCAGKNVLCIDDYVCSGQSLRTVMNSAVSYGCASVQCASINNSREGNHMKEVINTTKFHLYEI